MSARIVSLALALVIVASCSGDDNGSTAKDAAPGTDSTLWKCSEPGLACNAHDPCAINPVCGEDYLCHPSFRQDCNDGLDCTKDSCGGPGQCINTPEQGYCALLVKKPGGSEMTCFRQGDPNPADPCQQCDPQKSQGKWSDASGAPCDDKDPCSQNDKCVDGQCKGTFVSCSDGLVCTQDICDGKGGCGYKLKPGYCAIIGAGGKKECHKDGAKDPSGCAVCDVSKDPAKWTPLAGLCKIGTSCYQPGDKDSTGCGVCDPKQSGTEWSPATDACLIGGLCYQPGAKSPLGCASCDPKQSAAAWTPDAGKCLVDGKCHQSGAKSASGCGTCDPLKSADSWTPVSGSSTLASIDFESGASGLTLDPAVKSVGWQVSQSRAHGGKASLYYGDQQTKSYDNGAQNKGSATLAAVTLAAGKKSALTFWLYLDAETGDGFDVLSVTAGTQTVWQKSAATVPPASYRGWIPIEVDLSALAGTSVTIKLTFDTKDDWSNSGEGVYIDDLRLITGC